MIIGVPNYDHGACVAYCIDELFNNGFLFDTRTNLLLYLGNIGYHPMFEMK